MKALSSINPRGYSFEAAADPGPQLGRRMVERRDVLSRERLVQRVLAEFHEMPCLRLTPAQAERLFGLKPDISARVINTLIKGGHLRLDPDGRYAAPPK